MQLAGCLICTDFTCFKWHADAQFCSQQGWFKSIHSRRLHLFYFYAFGEKMLFVHTPLGTCIESRSILNKLKVVIGIFSDRIFVVNYLYFFIEFKAWKYLYSGKLAIIPSHFTFPLYTVCLFLF